MEAINDKSGPRPFIPYPWNPKQPLLWAGFKEKELGKYTLDLDEFVDRLDKNARNRSNKNDPENLAKLNRIESRLRKDNLTSLNILVDAVDLGSFFINNHKPSIAKLWTPWTLPLSDSVLEGNQLEDVHKFLSNIIRCISESKNYHVQFSKSSKFSNIVPLSANGKPMTKQDAAIFWQFSNNAPVDNAIESLYDSLHTAQVAAAEQGLLGDSPQ